MKREKFKYFVFNTESDILTQTNKKRSKYNMGKGKA